MVDPVNMFLLSSLITMQNLVVVCLTVWAYVGIPKIVVLGPRRLGIRIVRNLESRPSPDVYRLKFGRSISNRMGVGKGC